MGSLLGRIYDFATDILTVAGLKADEVYQVDSFAAIETAVQTDGIDKVSLKPGDYSIDETDTVSIDAANWSETREIEIDVTGCKITYSGTGTLPHGPFEVLNQETASNNGRVKIVGGEFVGPGDFSAVSDGSVACYVEDSNRVWWEPLEARGFQKGFDGHINTAGSQCESLVVKCDKIRNTIRPVHFRTSVSDDSFADARVRVQVTPTEPNSNDCFGVDLDGVSVRGSQLYVVSFINDSHEHGLRLDPTNVNNAELRFIADGSGSGVGIELISMPAQFPFAMCQFGHGGTNFGDPNSTNFLHMRAGGNAFVGLEWYEKNTKVAGITSGGDINLRGSAQIKTVGSGQIELRGQGQNTATKVDDILELNGRTSDPSSPNDGQIWHRSDNDELRVQLGGSTFVIDTTAA